MCVGSLAVICPAFRSGLVTAGQDGFSDARSKHGNGILCPWNLRILARLGSTDHRSRRPGAWDQQRWCAGSRLRGGRAGRRRAPCSDSRWRRMEGDVKVLCVEKLGATILKQLRGQAIGRQRGQCLSRQLLNAIRLWPHWSHASTCPPSAPVRHSSIRHDATLVGRQRRVVLRAIGFAVAAEYVRQFRPRAGHRRELNANFAKAGQGFR